MKISYMSICTILLATILFSIIGLSLPITINNINMLNANHWHGTFASYAVAILLFWASVYNIKMIKEEKQ